MQIIEKVKNICNYQEKFINSNQISVSWVETILSSDEEYIREQKRKNRELSIDVVLDEITESDWQESKSQSDYQMNIDEEYSNIITPKIMSSNINGKKYSNKSDIYDHLISFIETKTGNKKKKVSGNSNMNLDVQLNNDINLTDSENYEANLRRIITKVNMHSNIIAMDGRIGPGNSILIGKNNWEYFHHIEIKYSGIRGMKFIYEDSIGPNKIIVCRSNNTIEKPGIILVDDTKNHQYFFKETNFWDRQYSWFWIK